MPDYNRGGSGGRRNDNHDQHSIRNFKGEYIENGKIKEKYLEGGYFNLDTACKALKTDLVLKAANEFALNLFASKPQLKKSQLRKYYNYCKGIQYKMRLRGLGYCVIEADFVSLVGYTKNALNKVVPKLFVDFIKRNTNAVKNSDDYNAFIKHFEMIVAYYPNND